MRIQTFFGDSITNNSTRDFVHAKHVHVYAEELRIEETSNRGACGHIGLQHIGQNFDIVRIGEHICARRLAH